MANQLKMAEVQAILSLARNGWSNRHIARQLGVHRETVGRHLRLAARGRFKPASTAPLGSGGGTDQTVGPEHHQATWREVIVQKLGMGLTAQRIPQDLCSDQGYTGSYYSVRWLVGSFHRWRRRRSVGWNARRVRSAGGLWPGAPLVGADGKRRSTWVFRIVLSHSRKGYSEAVHRQTTDDFLRCLENAFVHFGGLPRTLVIDNLRAAVTRADWFDPGSCPKVNCFARHYGIAILPTRPYTPRHKGKIERGIDYVKQNALKGRSFGSLAEENHHLLNWETQVADTRIHGTTKRQVKEVFESVEKPALLPMPAARFDLFQKHCGACSRWACGDQGSHYSVPPEFLGQRVSRSGMAGWCGCWMRRCIRSRFTSSVSPEPFPLWMPTSAAEDQRHRTGDPLAVARVECIGPHAAEWSQSMLNSRGIEGCACSWACCP